METGITIKAHPGTLTDGQIGDLADLARVMRGKSPHYSKLILDWIEQELSRRSAEDEPLEPRLLQVNSALWTNQQLADAMIAAHAAYQASDDSSPRVRQFLEQVSFTITCWAAMRLKKV